MSRQENICFLQARDVVMTSCPINEEWVIDGAPVARNAILSQSLDGSATALLWDCTAGVFHWYYNVDETVYVLGGEAIIRDDDGAERLISTGDHIYFRSGAHAVWRVENYIYKVAFCRNPVPRLLMLSMRVMRKFRSLIRIGSKPKSPSAMFTGAG